MRSRQHLWVPWSSVRPQGRAVMGGARCPNLKPGDRCEMSPPSPAPLSPRPWLAHRFPRTQNTPSNRQISCKISGGVKAAAAACAAVAAAFPAAEQPDLWEGSRRQVPAEVGR